VAPRKNLRRDMFTDSVRPAIVPRF